MAATPRRKKRPSRAAMGRLLREIEAEPKDRDLPPQLAGLIAKYTPREIPAEEMKIIRPFMLAAVTASGLTGVESVRNHRTHLAELAHFAIGRGVPLEVDRVLTTVFIDEYIRHGMAQQEDHLRLERRRRLLAMARTANPGPDSPAKLTPIGHKAIKPPYTPLEIAVIARVARVQPTPARQRDLQIAVALGAGAGADSIDVRPLRTDAVEDLAENGIRVHIGGPRPRVVVLRARFEDMLRDALTAVPEGALLLGRKEDRRNTMARVLERAVVHKVPRIEPARLRATWLADLMTDAIPLAVILQAAGLKSARTLSELQPHLGPWLAFKNLPGTDATLLRGETR